MFQVYLALVVIILTSTAVFASSDAVQVQDNKPTVLIIGASGAIGSSLTRHLLAKGHPVVAGLRKSPLPADIVNHPLLTQQFSVDCTDENSIVKVFGDNPSISIVWNLAAPLSVETASDPNRAHDVVVGGMDRILKAMRKNDVGRILFSDSIGSYGYDVPREGATARWLIENPLQDPGSDYGVQKRNCRELMSEFVAESPETRSSRFAVIPGVLHTDSSWGAGTTEYVLDAIKAASYGEAYASSVEMNATLPMIMRDDLIEGLFALTVAEDGALGEVQGGYAIAGFSFTAEDLLEELRMRRAGVEWFVKERGVLMAESPAALFARLWPDSLSGAAAERDLGFVAKSTNVGEMVEVLLAANDKRRSVDNNEL